MPINGPKSAKTAYERDKNRVFDLKSRILFLTELGDTKPLYGKLIRQKRRLLPKMNRGSPTNPKGRILLKRKCKHPLVCISKPERIAHISSICFVKPP